MEIKTLDIENIEICEDEKVSCEARGVNQIREKSSDSVRYLLDGIVYSVPRWIIAKRPESVLASCLSADIDQPPEIIPIDRAGTWFTLIIKYISEDSIKGIELTLNQVKSIEKEADFYGLTELVKYCQALSRSFVKPEARIIHLIGEEATYELLSNAQEPLVIIYSTPMRYLDLEEPIAKLAQVCGENNCPCYEVALIPLLKVEEVNDRRFVAFYEPQKGYTVSADLIEDIASIKAGKYDEDILLKSEHSLLTFIVELQRKLSQSKK